MESLDLSPTMPARSRDDILVALAGLANPAPRARAAEPAGGQAALFMRVLDELDYGLMLVTDAARVRFANRMALRECASARCVRLQEGHVRPRGERELQDFQRALAAARLGRRSMLVLRSADVPLSLAIVPVADAEDGSLATLLVFGRRQVCEPLTVEFFAREHRLTGAEVTVLRGLCAGLRPSQIAHEAGVAVSTVRTQIGSIRMKTGTSTIRALLQQIASLPPLMGALRGVQSCEGD